MKYITQTTENRIKEMIKKEHKFGEALQQILDEMKCRESWYGATIKEMKESGCRLSNATQINVPYYYQYLYNGLSVIFGNLFYVTFTSDLHYANIYDFNKLVKKVSEMEYNGYGTYY